LQGDSGGPNNCYDPHRNQWFLFSTVSYGPFVCERTAGDKWLTVAADVAHYRDWIEKTIKENQVDEADGGGEGEGDGGGEGGEGDGGDEGDEGGEGVEVDEDDKRKRHK